MPGTPRVVVLGAGLAGLAAAAHLNRRGVGAVVVEASPNPHGMAASERDADGFSYDLGAHFITNRLAAAVGIGAQCDVVARYGEQVLLGGKHYAYPLGLMTSPRYAASAVRARLQRTRDVVSAADWFRANYGAALAEDVAIPLVAAWSGLPADQLSAEVASKIPGSIAQTVWLTAVKRAGHRAVAIGYCGTRPQSAAVFHVAPREGAAAVTAALIPRLEHEVRVSSPAEAIYVEDGRVVGVRAGGQLLEADAVVSTIPLPLLARIVSGSEAAKRFGQFRFRGIVAVNIKVDTRHVLPDTMVWVPDNDPFFRLTEAPLSMPHQAPPGKSIVLCEIGAQPGDHWWTMADDDLARACLQALDERYPGVGARYLGHHVQRLATAYPVYDLAYEADRTDFARNGTGIDGLISIGRNGGFRHHLMEDIYWTTISEIDSLVDGDRRLVRQA